MSKKWDIKSEVQFASWRTEFKVEDFTGVLLKNRGLKTKKEIDEFLNPAIEKVTSKSVGINSTQLKKAVTRIREAIKKKEAIVVFGDYDVDGICGTAILWETLYKLSKEVHPYIPHRIDEGYGLSIEGIKNLELKIKNIGLIITVDNGIVANEAVEFAIKQGIDVIITDHHVPSKNLPKAYSIVHTTKVCGAGVAYLLSQELRIKSSKLKIGEDNHLELVALATVADLVPLIGPNRTFLKFGLEKLKETKRPGLLELYKEAVINPKEVRPYEIGHMIAPRLNAMGRLEYAMDALRLLCTKDPKRAVLLAQKLGQTNRERQVLTQEAVAHASTRFKNGELEVKKLLFISHKTYQQGVIGLVAGRLVEEYYHPAIVVSEGDPHSKASARSVAGFNIIEFIRSASEFLIDAGGHPMAAGFTFETAKLSLIKKHLEDLAEKLLDNEKLLRTLRIDCELPLEFLNNSLLDILRKFEPFGMANPEPFFVSRRVQITDMRLVGKENRHLKLKFQDTNSPSVRAQGHGKKQIDAIAFGMGERSKEFKIGNMVDIVYSVEENLWNGNKSLQLKLKDVIPGAESVSE